jgi:hypothetical protein
MGQVYSGNYMYRVPWRYCNIREGGVRMPGMDTAAGLRAGVQNQEFGWRQRAMLSQTSFSVCFQA